MLTAHPRLGAIVLGVSAFLLATFPLIRPFFALDVFAPEKTISLASPIFVSTMWSLSHYLAMLGFVLLQGGVLALYAFHVGSPGARLAFRGLAWSLPGIALILPALGVEAYTMPIIGRLHLEGATGLAPAIALTYRGPMTVVLLLGQLCPRRGRVQLRRGHPARRTPSPHSRLRVCDRPRAVAAHAPESCPRRRWAPHRSRRNRSGLEDVERGSHGAGSERPRARGWALDEEETLHQPGQAHHGHAQRGGSHHARLPTRAAHQEEERQKEGDHERLSRLHAEIETKEGEGEATRRQGERLHGGREDLLEIVMRRYERTSTLITSNRPVEDWGKLLGDTAAVAAMLDRLLHHAHVLTCGPKSWRTRLHGERAAW